MMLTKQKKPLGHSGTIVNYPFVYAVVTAIVIGVLSALGGFAVAFLVKS